jgi:DnaJ-class molecular chaperone
VDARVKELYRTLVRRLHPDLRAGGNATVSALWHEVQEAYAASDVARMEILLALGDIEANRIGAGTSLSQMRSVLAELERASRALQKSLLEAQGEDAWNFARTGSDADLRLRVQRQLKSDLAARTMRLDLLKRTIAGWAQGPVANPKVIRERLFGV